MLACSEEKLYNYSFEKTLHNIHYKRTIKTYPILNYVFVRKTEVLKYNSDKQNSAHFVGPSLRLQLPSVANGNRKPEDAARASAFFSFFSLKLYYTTLQ